MYNIKELTTTKFYITDTATNITILINQPLLEKLVKCHLFYTVEFEDQIPLENYIFATYAEAESSWFDSFEDFIDSLYDDYMNGRIGCP